MFHQSISRAKKAATVEIGIVMMLINPQSANPELGPLKQKAFRSAFQRIIQGNDSPIEIPISHTITCPPPGAR